MEREVPPPVAVILTSSTKPASPGAGTETTTLLHMRSSCILHLLHHLHDDCPGPGQDQVADGSVVLREDVQSVHRHHKLTHLQREETWLPAYDLPKKSFKGPVCKIKEHPKAKKEH